MTPAEAFEHIAIDGRDRLAQLAASERGLSRELFRATVAQYDGRVETAISSLRRQLAHAHDKNARALIADLLIPIYISRHELDLADALLLILKAGGLVASFASFAAIIAAERGMKVTAGSLIARGKKALCHIDDIHLFRNLQRLALASFYLNRFEDAIRFSLASAAICRELGAWRSATASYSILYNIQLSVLGDFKDAYRYARAWRDSAARSGDRSFLYAALIAEYSLAAQFGDRDECFTLESQIRGMQLPRQYSERFAFVFAFALTKGCLRLSDMKTILEVLRDTDGISNARWSLCTSLITLCHAASHEDSLTRQTNADISMRMGRYSPTDPAYERHFRRLTRMVMAAAYVLIGEEVRAARVLKVTEMSGFLDVSLFIEQLRAGHVAEESVADSVRGFAQVINCALRLRAFNAAPAGLTRSEYEVLKLYGIGWNAARIAKETNRSVNTVYNHTRAILGKLAASRAGEAVAIARARGLL